MKFIVPKFIDREARILGPLTFKQFLGLGGVGAILFMLYYSLPFSIFIISAVILTGTTLSFVFIKIQGQPLPFVLKNFLTFSSNSKIFLWKKKDIAPKIIKKQEIKKTKETDAVKLKITQSKLKNLSSKLEL
ncbi:MAG: PrgI family protein [Patescibacteria group bacterium]|nr:PrgI family protein [Patescibacteria group bacterium]